MASMKKGNNVVVWPPPEAYTDDDPRCWSNMFGSLLSLADAPPTSKIKLTENWYKIIRRWYPDLHQKVYCVPPVHFKAVSYRPAPEPYKQYKMHKYQPAQYSTTKDDEAQQRVLWTMSTFLRRKGVAAFVLSNMEFQNYLNKGYEWEDSSIQDFPKPDIRNKNEEGEIDVLVIDKIHGVFVLEVKAVGDPDTHRPLSKEAKLTDLSNKFSKIGRQVEKEKSVIKKLLSDLDPEKRVKVRGGFVLANTERTILDEALDLDPASTDGLVANMGVRDKEMVSDCTICSDDLPEMHVSGEEEMSDEIFKKLDKVWTALQTADGESEPMGDDLYERIAARFCGPLTTVKIYTEKTMPRVKLENISKQPSKNKKKGSKQQERTKTKVKPEEVGTKAGAARVMARRFSELVLLEEQIEILQRNEDFVHLEGPPGTGKTLVLLLRILTWLDAGHMVWILSLSPPSRSVTHVLMEQVKRMIRMCHSEDQAKEILKDRLRMFMMIRPEASLDAEYFKRRLLKFRLRAKTTVTNPLDGYTGPPTMLTMTPARDRKVCLALDESGMSGKGLDDFFRTVSEMHRAGDFRCAEFDKGLSVWSASLEKVGRPMYVTEPGKCTEEKFGVLWELTMPLRCPPTVQRALILVQPSLDQENVCCFKEDKVLPHPAHCVETGDVAGDVPGGEKAGVLGPQNQYAAEGLPVYLIAHGNHKKAHEDIWFCFECGDDLANFLQNTLRIGQEECSCPDQPVCYDAKLATCPECKKPAKGTLPAGDVPLKYNDVMIVATQSAFLFSVPIGGFALAMAKRKLKVAVNTTREEGDAPIPADDTILIVDLTSVHGLERAVIIVIPEVKPPPPRPSFCDGILPPILKDGPASQAPKPGERGAEAGMAGGQAEERDHIIMTPDGRGEEELPDDAEEAAPDGADKTERSTDPVLVKLDPTIKAALRDGEDLAVTGDGKVEPPADEDVEMRDEEPPGGGGDYSSKGGHPSPSGPKPDIEMRNVSAGVEKETNMVVDSAAEAPGGKEERKDMDIRKAQKDPYTYADSKSKQQIQAALESLSPQSRQDVFYIGSRAVCQLVLIHPGKDPMREDRSEQPMQTG